MTSLGWQYVRSRRFVARGRLWNAIGEECKAVALVELKGLFEKDRGGVHSEGECWGAGDFLTVQVRREMTGIGEGDNWLMQSMRLTLDGH